MKNFRIAALILLLAVFTGEVISQDSPASFFVHSGRLLRVRGAEALYVDLPGSVLLTVQKGVEAYYLSASLSPEGGADSMIFSAGRTGGDYTAESAAEVVRLTCIKAGSMPLKLDSLSGIIYITLKVQASGDTYVVRADLNAADEEIIEEIIQGAADFVLAADSPVLLTRGSEPALIYNDITIPLFFSGGNEILSVMDNRFVTVRGQDVTEIVDLYAMKSVYQYPENSVFVSPEEAGDNLVIEISDDEVSADFDIPVFYKVFLDLNEIGRTETGPAGSQRVFRMKVEGQGSRHLKIERWSLNRSRERYERENNISQPKTLTVIVPENRIMRLSLRYDGKVYSVNRSLLKYQIRK